MSESRQAGFSVIEILVAVAIISIMAAVAVPKFNTAIMTANTAKVQSDLTTLDAAIAVYQLEHGTAPANIDALSDYVSDIGNLKPPKGKCKLKNGEKVELNGTAVYSLENKAEGTRAVCSGHTAGEFGNGSGNEQTNNSPSI